MKIFFTNIPLQQQGALLRGVYEAADPPRLFLPEGTRFPILTAVNGYVEPEEEFRLVAVSGNTEAERNNLEYLAAETEELCRNRGFSCPRGVEKAEAPSDPGILSLTSIFQNLIPLISDDDELFACVTFGTKPQSMALLTALRYAYRIRKNVTITCVVYGKVDRDFRTKQETGRQVYDETALIRLDEITRMLADSRVKDPEKIIRSILTP